MTPKPLAQAGGRRRRPDSVSNMPCGHPEDSCIAVQQLGRGPDGQQGLGSFPADVEYHACIFLVRLGPAQGDERGAVVAAFDVAPSEGPRF